jgi:Phage integrase, N-terminal SAM-like domain/Phosphorylase superfamily
MPLEPARNDPKALHTGDDLEILTTGRAATPQRFNPRLADAFIYKSISEATRRTYRKAIKDFFAFVGLIHPSEVTREHVILYRDRLIEKKKSANTIARAAASPPNEGMVMRADELRGRIYFGIITVKAEEFQAVHNAFDGWRSVEGKAHTYFIAEVRTRTGQTRLVSLVRLLEQGQDVAQKVTRDLIEDLTPKWILLVGIAGGIPDNEYSLGDVLLASRIHDFAVSAALPGGSSQFNIRGGPVHPEVARLLEAIHGFDADFSGWNTRESIGMEKPSVRVPGRPDKRFYGEQPWKKGSGANIRKRASNQNVMVNLMRPTLLPKVAALALPSARLLRYRTDSS